MADFTMDRFSLKGKTALVTGAERGIGLEIAKGLAAAGANIIIAGLMEEEFPKAEAAVRAKGVSCTVLKADISKEEDVLRLAEQAWEIFPNGLDILVNNAGVNKLAPAEEMPLEVWQKVVGVNLTGTFLMCRTFGNRMLQQGHGNIVNVASMSGLVVNPLPQQQCAYNSSKAGVIMLTKCMANEWAQRARQRDLPRLYRHAAHGQTAEYAERPRGREVARRHADGKSRPAGRNGRTGALFCKRRIYLHDRRSPLC